MTAPSSSSSGLPASPGSSVLSPNHPANLRKQARANLDPSFSVRSYLGAAAALLEKAEGSDRQGHLESAFVNYIKAANVAAFISKHPEWPQIVASRNQTYYRYQDLMQRLTDVISRATRIEDTLKQREEMNASLQARQRASSSSSTSLASASSSQLSPSTSTTLNRGALSAPPPPAEPGPAKQLRTDGAGDAGDAASVLMNATIRLPATQRDAAGTGSGSGSQTPILNAGGLSEDPDHVGNLTDRLAALRSGGMGGVSMEKRLSEPGSPARSSLRSGSGEDVKASTAPLPNVAHFSHTYPTLDEFDQVVPHPDRLPPVPTTNPQAHGADQEGLQEDEGGAFPMAPSHAPGARRPLPNPPALPTELSLGRDVPRPFEYNAASSSSTPPSLPSPSLKPKGPAPRQGALLPPSKTSGRPKSTETAGPKAAIPRGNHIKVEELWSLLNPGFERVQASNGATSQENGGTGETRMIRKRGADILLLDMRSRDEFQAGRVGIGSVAEAVCLEGGVILRRGMTSSELEDKLLLAPSVEQNAFANRNAFDAVVIYDRSTRSLGLPSASGYNPAIHGWPTYDEAMRAWESLDIVVKAIYEHEFAKTLKNAPLLLVGGWESWRHKVEDRTALAGGPPQSASTNSRSARGGPPSASSLRRSSVQEEDELLKKQRRQGFVAQEQSGRESPTSTYRVGSGGFSAGAQYAGLSVPAKAYQGPMTPGGSAPPAGAPSFPPSASGRDGFFQSQPSIPYGSGLPSSAPSMPGRSMSGGFDYPQLKSGPQPPPAAVPSNGISTRSMTSHAHTQSMSSPASAAARGQTSPEISRRPPNTPNTALASAGSRANIRMLPAFDDLRIGLTGLKNVGNSCYQNATLQCLSATIPLAKFMLDGSYKKAINTVNPLGTQGALAEAFAHLLKVMWSEQYTFVSPVTFREAISRFASTFRGYDQHDSQEFLAFLLDGLHEDLNYVVHKPPPVDMTPERENELETLPQQVASVKEWTIYRQRNDSLIVDWFQGQFRNKMTCLTCGKTSTTYNAFMYLSLPIPSGRGVTKATLFQCLDAFVKEEVMDKADAWFCPACKKPRKATKRLSISRLPMILLIHLKRFSFKGPFTDKIETQVTFPIQGLDLTNYVPAPLSPALAKSYATSQGVPTSRSQVPPFVYDLYSVTHHFGSLNTGHYTASIKSAGQWWYCDDSRTVGPSGSAVSEGEKRIMSNSPYVLWFRRRP